MIWVYIYLIIGSFMAAASIGMLEKKSFLAVLGSLIVVLFWPWIIFIGIGRNYK